ncbi:MAG TPA: tetratricopeptide repeat protein [Bacteroidales bacterium]|nr:tetratricopeptide repeat protein [Bacteroidales bacterium]
MKKFFLLIAAISISFGAMSQKGKVTSALSFIDQGVLDKAKEAIDQALVHERSKDWYNTYFAKGKLCQAVFESDNPKFKAFYPEPLQEAYAAYEKSIELDPKGSVKKRIITNMVYNSLAVNLYAQGSSRFEEEDFAGALKSFETQIEITESDKYVGLVDTGMYYNAGLAATNSNKYEEAIKYFEKCAEMKYQGITPYYQIYLSYLSLGDTLKAESVLTGLTTLFPEDKTITLQLIDLYIKSNKNDEALKYIAVAKKDDPTNYSVFFAAGIIYLNENKYDEAIVELKKSLELKSDLYDTQYGLGAAYINKASDMFVKANEIMDVKEYSDAIDKANAVYAEALPYMERAYVLKPDDEYTMRSLQELYYRLKQKDPSLAAKYEMMKAKLDSLENK